jgi:hypothetical protein
MPETVHCQAEAGGRDGTRIARALFTSWLRKEPVSPTRPAVIGGAFFARYPLNQITHEHSGNHQKGHDRDRNQHARVRAVSAHYGSLQLVHSIRGVPRRHPRPAIRNRRLRSVGRALSAGLFFCSGAKPAAKIFLIASGYRRRARLHSPGNCVWPCPVEKRGRAIFAVRHGRCRKALATLARHRDADLRLPAEAGGVPQRAHPNRRASRSRSATASWPRFFLVSPAGLEPATP